MERSLTLPNPPDLRTPPRAVRVAVLALLLALVTGIVEMLDHLWPFAHLGDSVLAIVIRLMIYTGVLVCIMLFARGHPWARLVLLFGLGVVGLASLLVDPLIWLVSSPDLVALVGSMDAQLGVVTVSRVVHFVADLVAVVAMLRFASRQ